MYFWSQNLVLQPKENTKEVLHGLLYVGSMLSFKALLYLSYAVVGNQWSVRSERMATAESLKQSNFLIQFFSE